MSKLELTFLPEAEILNCYDVVEFLVLEDNEFDLARLRRLIAKLGAPTRMRSVTSLAEFRDALRIGAFEVVLLDHNLPDGDGLEALRLLRDSALHKDTPAIMLVGEAEVGNAVSAMKAGCSDYIDKAQLSPDILRAAIYRALAASSVDARDSGGQAALPGFLDAATRAHIARLRPLPAQVEEAMKSLREDLTGDLARRAPKIRAINEACRDIADCIDDLERALKAALH